jgi:predicted phage-related endonuclease
MRRGRHLEAAVADWFAEEHGLELFEPDVLYLYGDVLVATLDRRIAGSDDIVEIKTIHGHCSSPEPHWVHQVQAQMLATGAPRAHVVVLDASLDLHVFAVEADVDHGRRLYEAAASFLAHIRAGEVPPDVKVTYRAAALLHPEATVIVTELDDEAVGWCDHLDVLQRRIRLLESEEDELKGLIANRLGDAAEGHHEGRRVVTWRGITRTTIDVKRLRAERPDVAQTYDQTLTHRVLRLVKEREGQ